MKSNSYKNSGVNIEAGNELVEKIKPLAKSTHRTGANANLGGFGGLFDLAACKYNDPVLVSANDGVGTKLMVAFESGKHDTIGIDLVAMCVNDLVVQGAEPLFFLDYFASGKLEVNVAHDVIKGIADGCKISNAALIGGETAEMPGMYSQNHYDLAGFAVGAVERDAILPSKDIQKNDVIIGIESNGLHSNGFSLVRKIITQQNITYDQPTPFDNSKTFSEELLTPTTIYVKECLELCKHNIAKAFAHITGGGFIENIPRILPQNLAANIDYGSWDILPIFNWLEEVGNIDKIEMLRTFNCGVGMIMVTDNENKDKAIELLAKHNKKAYIIGNITDRIDDPININGI